MMKKIVFAALCFFSLTLQAQKIERSKDDLKSSPSQSSGNSSGSSNSSRSNYTDDDSNIWLELLFNITFGVFKFGLIGDYTNENHLYNRLTMYPYADGFSGNYTPDSITGKRFRLDLENNVLYSNNNLFGNHLKAKIRPFQYFFVQADYRELFERRTDNTTDNLALFHFNIAYDRVRLRRFNLGWTLGASYVGSTVRKAGFSYGLQAEYFAGKNISFAGSAKWSKINGFPVNAYEFQGRWHKKQFFASAGFQHLKIATPTYNFFTVGGGLYL